MMVLRLFNGWDRKGKMPDDWGTDGPTFRVEFAHTVHGCDLNIGHERSLVIDDGAIYYDGVWYSDWSAYEPDANWPELSPFDQFKARLPAQKPREHVVIEVVGGCASVKHQSDGVDVEIFDHDNA